MNIDQYSLSRVGTSAEKEMLTFRYLIFREPDLIKSVLPQIYRGIAYKLGTSGTESERIHMSYDIYLIFYGMAIGDYFQPLLATLPVDYIQKFYDGTKSDPKFNSEYAIALCIRLYMDDRNRFDGTLRFTYAAVSYSKQSRDISDLERVIILGKVSDQMYENLLEINDVRALARYFSKLDIADQLIEESINDERIDTIVSAAIRCLPDANIEGLAYYDNFRAVLNKILDERDVNQELLDEVQQLYPFDQYIVKLLNAGVDNWDEVLQITNNELVRDYRDHAVWLTTMGETVYTQLESDEFIEKFAENIGWDLQVGNVPIQHVRELLPSFWYQRQQFSYIRNLDEQTKNAIHSYIDAGYRTMNSLLRQGKSNKNTDLITEAFNNAPQVDREFIVFRHVNDTNFITSNEFRSLGFMSTTLNFNRLICSGKELMIIQVPVDKRVLYIEGQNEQEVLLPNDIKLNVISHQEKIVYYDVKTKKNVTRLVTKLRWI